ncbi:MAG: BLUF domain-containing protein [Nonlabens sp.]
MQSLHTICYISNSKENLSEDEMEDLFKTSSIKNNESQITGILLHEMGRFFQVLEGEEKLVNDLFYKIRKDSRHGNIYVVYDQKSHFPVFKGYNSKFNVVKSYDDLNRIKTYLEKSASNSTRDKIARLLTPFLMLKEA